MSTFTANTSIVETRRGYTTRLFIPCAFMLLIAVLWSALVAPASAGSPTGSQKNKDTTPDAPMCDPNWQVVASPNVLATYKTYLRGTDGKAPADMWAVGYAETGGLTQAIIQHWDGTTWSLASIPSVGTESSALYGITALSTTDIWAVGNYKDTLSSERTLILHWNGTSWSTVASPNVGSGANILKGVHGLYANNVWAVGYYVSGATSRTLTMRWNGTSWSTVSSPYMGTMSMLEAVAVASSSHIWAVGRYTSNGKTYPITMRWNGTSWNMGNYNAENAYLHGIAALSPTDIWAVGVRYNCGILAYTCSVLLHWDGSYWLDSGYDLDNIPGYTMGMYSVRATSATSVWAVGYYNQNNTFYSLVLKWDGSAWNMVTSPNASGNNVFYGVGASGLSNVWAVGNHSASDGLIEKWNGTQWSLASSPDINLTSNYLDAADAIYSTDVWSVGHSTTNGIDTPLIEHWNGATWNTVSAPTPAGTGTLKGVAAVSASDVWAVGSYNSGQGDRTLVQRWNGVSWSTIISPNPGPRSFLTAVTAIAANDVWAVGYSTSGTIQKTVTLHWNGSLWNITSSPNIGSDSNYLTSISATSANDVWAVGRYYNGNADKTLVLHWNGTSWSTVTSPNAGASTSANSLTGITALAANDAWAVGSFFTSSGLRTLILHWNGTSWSTVSSPNVGVGNNQLFAIDKVSATDLWAVGHYHDGTAYRTLVQRWNGASWTVVTTPNATTSSNNALNSLTIASPTDVFAVGSYSASTNTQTLVERYNPCN